MEIALAVVVGVLGLATSVVWAHGNSDTPTRRLFLTLILVSMSLSVVTLLSPAPIWARWVLLSTASLCLSLRVRRDVEAVTRVLSRKPSLVLQVAGSYAVTWVQLLLSFLGSLFDFLGLGTHEVSCLFLVVTTLHASLSQGAVEAVAVTKGTTPSLLVPSMAILAAGLRLLPRPWDSLTTACLAPVFMSRVAGKVVLERVRGLAIEIPTREDVSPQPSPFVRSRRELHPPLNPEQGQESPVEDPSPQANREEATHLVSSLETCQSYQPFHVKAAMARKSRHLKCLIEILEYNKICKDYPEDTQLHYIKYTQIVGSYLLGDMLRTPPEILAKTTAYTGDENLFLTCNLQERIVIFRELQENLAGTIAAAFNNLETL